MMRLRRKRFYATVSVQPGDYPIVLGFGPAINLEATIGEAMALGHAIADAIELARQRSQMARGQ